MGLFDDFNRFLEDRLEEFLRNNPHLELQALEEQLREQEEDTLRLIGDLNQQQKNLQDEILAIAQDIQRWHERVEKAQSHGRQDLAQAAQEREASLLRQGNQRWGQMEGVKQRITQSQELIRQIQTRRQEVRTKAKEVEAARASNQAQSQAETFGWNQSSSRQSYSGSDPLDDQFRRWELQEELDQMKRNLGR
ncbi:TIGR04376 family protein [Allocoleopsis sp.]|uniref:TIGR04376 family protein n=1 Tax=Allocoleopsis sp. TaxID=3088169 RepID=UPI002FCFE836